ncbi:hypothetical protein NP493_913g02035 [Ridgeia piscesae]|uniref:Uncharacterized protein n=1 Tax=Ridgeia piscesae TaxID=27915 RepID=A0AAD9KKR8_RIDPI|nr:hypothetical protein NP493_913g02035 [Ridgeia piscesae]
MDNDESCNDSIVETSDLDSNATVSPMLPGLYSLFERHKTVSPEGNEDFPPVVPMIGHDILMVSNITLYSI